MARVKRSEEETGGSGARPIFEAAPHVKIEEGAILEVLPFKIVHPL